MKKFVFSMFILFFSTVVVFSQNQSDFEVQISDDNTVSIIGYKGAAKDIVIPETLFNMPLKGINAFAFVNKGLTSVKLPASLSRIETGVFGGNKLTSIELPAALVYIGNLAFYGNSIAAIKIPDTVTHIGQGAFQANKIAEAVIPVNVKIIGSSAFAENRMTKLTLNQGLAVIGDNAFTDCRLTSVEIPDSVIYIGGGAFKNSFSESLTSIKIGSLVVLGRYPYSSSGASNNAIEAFPYSFDAAYTTNTGQAGTYRYDAKTKTWSFTAQ
jgi:hypothetical protein